MFLCSFKVNKPIVLTSVGFWGPFATGKRSAYKVKIFVSQFMNSCDLSENPSNDVFLGESEDVLEAEPKEIFNVPLHDEPLIAANLWTRIRFQLDVRKTNHFMLIQPQMNFNYFEVILGA